MSAPRNAPRVPRVLIGSLLVAGALALGACGSDDDDDDVNDADPMVEDTGDVDGAGETSMPAPGTVPGETDDMSPVTYAIPLTVEEEVPEPTGVPEGATGAADLVFDPATNGITGTVTTSGLSGPPTAAHIHIGAPGEAGPIVVGFVADGSGTGTFELPGDSVLNEEEAEALETGLLYVNVHTELNEAGEIRGQIVEQDPEDVDDTDDGA